MNPPNRSESVCLENRFDCLVVLIHWKQLGNIFPSNSYLSHKPTFPFCLAHTSKPYTKRTFKCWSMSLKRRRARFLYATHGEIECIFNLPEAVDLLFCSTKSFFFMSKLSELFSFSKIYCRTNRAVSSFPFVFNPCITLASFFFSLSHNTAIYFNVQGHSFSHIRIL